MSGIGKLKKRDRKAVELFVANVRVFLGDKLYALTIYGSKVRGDDNDDSDIDLLVVVDGLTWKIESKIMDIAYDIELEYDVLLSTHIIDKSLFQNKLWEHTVFAKNIKREGISI